MYDSRASGVLLAVSSLPGPYGIGSLGAPARRFVDFLADAGQTYWQILPLVPPGHGNSPYMSPSAFAGNPYLIDLDELVSMGLLTHQEVESARRDSLIGWTTPISRPPGWICFIRHFSAFLAGGLRFQRRSTSPGWRTMPSSPLSTTSIKPIAVSGPRMLSRILSGWLSTPFFRISSISNGST